MDLNKLYHDLYIVDRTPASTEEEIATLLRKFPNIPKEYIAFTRKVGDLTLRRYKDETFFLRIWHSKRPEDFEEGYHFSHYIPGSIPIGDNGRCDELMYLTGPEGFGIYVCHLNQLRPHLCRFVARTLAEILCKGKGLDVIWKLDEAED
jgi:hypothetical protein